MGTQVVRVEPIDHGALSLTLARPESRNALDAEVMTAMAAALDQAAADPGIRSVVIRADGEKVFSTGADLKELRALSAAQAEQQFRRGHKLFRGIETLGKPVVAQVDGFALGGGFELCLACSFVIASTRARFGLPEAGLGLIPGYGGTQRLTRAIGRQRALRVMLLGETLDAEEAYRLGMLSFPPVEPDRLDESLDQVLAMLATRSPHAQEAILALVDVAEDGARDTGLRLERELALLARNSEDGQRGIDGFLAKQRIRYPGRATGTDGEAR